MRNVVGNPVSGEDFFGREDELGNLIRLITNGNHTLIKSPRRVGKSSLVAEASRILRERGWKTIEIDVQQCTDEANFLKVIAEAIEESEVDLPQDTLEKISGKLSDLRKSLAGFKGGVAGVNLEVPEFSENWEDASGQLRSALKRLAKHRDKTLLTMDELPIFLSELSTQPDGEQRVKKILNWLRSVRIACGTNLPWVFCGSIGLNNFVRKRDLDGTINDFADVYVGVMSCEEATNLLEKLVASSNELSVLPESVINRILEKIGWLLPYYLQLMFHSLLSVSPRSNDFPTVADVDAAYKIAIKADSLRHWSSRLNQLLSSKEQKIAKGLLDAISTQPNGIVEDKLLNLQMQASPGSDSNEMRDEISGVLKLLEDDGYLHFDNGKFAFRSFLLRDHWLHEIGGKRPNL